jgi:hypothetical protein
MRATAVAVLVTLAALIGTTAPARAQPPEKVFGGQVLLSDKRYPMSAKSAAAYIAALRKQTKTNFQEDKDKKQWKIYFAAFFKSPLNDVEVQAKLYDITPGQPRVMMSSFDQYLDERGQRSLVSSMVLERKQFGVNKQLMVTIESGGKVIAAGKFKILGDVEKSSGKVDFSDEETKGNGDE